MGRGVSCILEIITCEIEFTGQFSLYEVNYKLTRWFFILIYLLTYLLIYLLTPWSKVLLKQL